MLLVSSLSVHMERLRRRWSSTKKKKKNYFIECFLVLSLQTVPLQACNCLVSTLNKYTPFRKHCCSPSSDNAEVKCIAWTSVVWNYCTASCMDRSSCLLSLIWRLLVKEGACLCDERKWSSLQLLTGSQKPAWSFYYRASGWGSRRCKSKCMSTSVVTCKGLYV